MEFVVDLGAEASSRYSGSSEVGFVAAHGVTGTSFRGDTWRLCLVLRSPTVINTAGASLLSWTPKTTRWKMKSG